MNKYLLALPVVALSGLFLAGCIGQKQPTPPAEPTPESTMTQDISTTDPTATEQATSSGQTGTNNDLVAYTLEDVAVHNTKSDCWTVIAGDVYDLSPFLTSGKHPGGDAAVQACGKDGTTLFETRPMGSGTPHSSKARQTMANFLIGTLAK